MTSTIATVLTEVQRRLRNTSPGTTDFSTTEASDYIRLGFQDAAGRLPVIKHAAVTLSLSSYEVLSGSLSSLTDLLRIEHVETNEKLLIPGVEWTWVNSALQIDRSCGQNGDVVGVYYVASIDVVAGTTTSVDTSCIFAADWLEEPATIYAEMQCLGELARNAATGGGNEHGAQYRAMEHTYEKAINDRQIELANWRQSKAQQLQLRMALKPPLVANPLSTFENLSEIRSAWRP